MKQMSRAVQPRLHRRCLRSSSIGPGVSSSFLPQACPGTQPRAPLTYAAQVHREFRKPLIVVAPKKLLRLKEASSSLEEMGANTMFQMVIPEVS